MTTRTYIWRLLHYRGWLFGLTLFLYLLLYAGFIVPAWIAREILNLLTGDNQYTFGFWSLIGLLLLTDLVRVASFYGILAGEVCHYHSIYALLRANLFEQILQRPGARALPYSPSEALSRLRDDVETSQWFWSMCYNLGGNAAFTAIALGLMLAISPRLTLVVILPLIVVVWLVKRAQDRIERYRATQQGALGRVTGLLGEIFGAVQAIKVAAAEEHVLAHFAQVNEQRSQAAIKDQLFSALLYLFFDNIGDLGAAAMLLLAAQSMRTGSFTVGDFALFVFFLPWITGAIGTVGKFISAYQQVGVSRQRLLALLQGAAPPTLVRHRPVYLWEPLPPVPPPQRRAAPLRQLVATGLTYHHPDSGRGITGIDLHLAAGSFTVITGRVGAGKTTLLRTLLGLLPKQAGEIRWNGELIEDPANFFTPPHSAYTAQTPRLFSATLAENMLMGQPLHQPALDQALHHAVLAPDLARLEQGLASRVGARGVRLSGGQVQRVAAARMLLAGGARGVDLLVFDDLSSALDVATEALLWERLFAHPNRPACLVVSHRPAALQRADQIIVLNEGKVEVIGKWGELQSRLRAVEEVDHETIHSRPATSW